MRPAQHRTERPHRPPVRVFGTDRLEPAAIVAHKVAKPPRRGVESVGKKRQIPRREVAQVGVVVALEPDARQQRPGVVVGGVALVVVRHRIERVLKDAGVVGQAAQMAQLEGRKLGRALRQGFGKRRARRARPAFARPHKRRVVARGDLAPDHPPPVQIRALSQGVTFGVVTEKCQHVFGERRGVGKRGQYAATLSQEFFGVPVGRRDDGLTRAECVGERPRGDLLAVGVGR